MRRRRFTQLAVVGLMLSLTSRTRAGGRSVSDVQHVLSKVDLVRGQAGVAALQWDDDLAFLADHQASAMHRVGVVTHLDLSGRDPAERAVASGFHVRILGETLAEAFDGPKTVVSAWLDARDTRAVLLNPDAHHVGIGRVSNSLGRSWWSLITGDRLAGAKRQS